MSKLTANTLGHLGGNSSTPSNLTNFYPQSASGVVGLVGIQLASCIFGLGFTGPSSLLRLALLPIIGGSVWTLGQTCTDVMPRLLVSNIIGGITCGWLTQYVVSGLLKNEKFEDGGPSREKGGKDVIKNHGGGIMERVWFGLNTINLQRNIGTPQEAKNTPHFSSEDPSYVPSRKAFLLRTGMKMMGTFLLLDLMTLQEQDIAQHPVIFAADKVPFFSRLAKVTLSELGTRASISIGHWVGSYIFLQFVHSTLAFFTVLPGFYEPMGWPPLFNSFTSIYSIRQYWGTFYHQLMRYKLETISTYITNDLLQLPKGTLIRRYADIFYVFAASGVCHLMMDVWGTITARQSGAMQFFCTQAIGIMIEDGIQGLYRRWKGMTRTSAEPKPWIKVLGFAWTAAFLIWSTPAWIYPGLRSSISGPKGQLLPFSVLQMFWK